MAKEIRRIPFDEFAANLASVFDRVVRESEAVVVESEDGERAILKAIPSAKGRRRRSEADYQAFLASAGSWKDVDTDQFIADVYASRRGSSRPPVEL